MTAYREGFAELTEDTEEMQGAELGEVTVGTMNIGEIENGGSIPLIRSARRRWGRPLES